MSEARLMNREQPLPDPKLDALARFTRQMVEQRGWLDAATVQAFLDAGYSRAHVLDVLVGVTMKTLSNYANHLLHTPVDDAFAAERGVVDLCCEEGLGGGHGPLIRS